MSSRPRRAPAGPDTATADSAAAFLPAQRDLASLRSAAKNCRGCPLWEPATQTVFGEGPAQAKLLLIGEQPGNEEDLNGRPFVGPAGKVLDRALGAAEISRGDVYVTNAVKHFSFQYRGKRRLHSKPYYRHITACHPWLEAELSAVRPRVIVCLGATASQALLGSSFRMMQHLGEVLETRWADALIVSYHPSALLRMPDPAEKAKAFEQLVHDLKTALKLSKAK